MKKTILTTIISAMSIAVALTGARAADRDEYNSTKAFHGFINAQQVAGATVRNFDNQEVGTIDRLLVDSLTGDIRFAVVSTGGFLGIGEHLSAIPWRRLEIRNKADADETPDIRIYLDTTKEKLEAAPKFMPDKEKDLYESTQSEPFFTYWELRWVDPVERNRQYDKDRSGTDKPRKEKKNDN